MPRLCALFAVLSIYLAAAGAAPAAVLGDPAAQAKVDARVAEIRRWAADPAIVAAVAAQDAALPAGFAAMTEAKWMTLSPFDPFVRSFAKNPAAAALRSKKASWASKAFVCDARGYKVAFLEKTISWCHAGTPKHEVPMSGGTWQGRISVDPTTGSADLQVSVPVLSEGKPIGSLVVNLRMSEL